MKYKLILNDCNKVLKRIESNSIDLVITDPPYGINYRSNLQTYTNHKSDRRECKSDKRYFETIANDDHTPVKWIKEIYRVLKDDKALYIYCRWDKYPIIYDYINTYTQFKIKNMIVLNKSNHGMGDLHGAYAYKHELVIYCSKGSHKLNKVNGRPKDCIDVPILYTARYRHHPNEKPKSWINPFILESSNIGDTILDPFMG